MEWVTMGKPDINSVEVHAQLSHNRNHPRDGVLVVWVHSGPLSLWVLSLVVHGSQAYTLRIDWNLWCHVMKFEISLGSHHYAMIGIFDVMLWRYHLGRTIMPWLESLMSCYEVWDITWVAPLHHDWNLWCHVMKFEIYLGRIVTPWLESLMSCYEVWDITWVAPFRHIQVTTLWTFWQDCQEGSSLSSSVPHLLQMEIAIFVIFVNLVNRRILKSWNYKNTSLLTSGGRVLITPLWACNLLSNLIITWVICLKGKV
jgi:hypothetical protein